MRFLKEIKRIELQYFLTKNNFTKEIKVAFSTIHKWKSSRAKPNINAMKNIKAVLITLLNYTNVKES